MTRELATFSRIRMVLIVRERGGEEGRAGRREGEHFRNGAANNE